ncbi:MAG: glycine--tRNA ligase subunit beta [Gammaproteobacteria bacterium]|nr:glycine--tRNA ligase subunit beta [Gammaproteobacteria bacterium]MDH3749199.1 glycine--tRNA ligase subunit beta [Gammaproteobacteria bacterium]
MSQAGDFLVEIGTEELPPKALRTLMTAFGDSLEAAVDEARLGHGPVHAFASPRRLAVLIESLDRGQDNRKTAQKGPPVTIAFDADGNITAAGKAFAKKCGVAVSTLGRTKTDKGEWLSCDIVETGKTTAELMPELITGALGALPIPRRMRWGAGGAEFVRPIHWIVLLHGSGVIKASIMGIKTGNKSRGHRFHTDKPVTVKKPADYLQTLEDSGHVIADFDKRRELVRKGVESEAKKAGGNVVDGESLYDEVTALVEWPVPLAGSFDDEFLLLPREVVISTLTSHQRYFPVADKDGDLLPRFITVANLDSEDPDQVRAGNERVVRPRLADAAFFWESDRRKTLAARQDALREVVYQRGLGSLYDKSARTAALAESIAAALGADAGTVARAAALAKSDLLTGMVGEFPELQGTMGRYYAMSDGEPQSVADAIAEQYLPRFSGDGLPTSTAGQILAVADKIDTLAGIFVIGKKPSGNRDPFGLRRAAVGLVRILIECELDLDLKMVLRTAVEAQPKGKAEVDEHCAALYTFVTDRLRRYFLDNDEDLATETFDAVLARSPASLVDFERRLRAVQAFTKLEPASSLAAANKRIANILKQAGVQHSAAVKEKLLSEPAELALWSALGSAKEAVSPMLEDRAYTSALTTLSELREPVDAFFDDVMVMVDNEATKNNRLALLGELRALFLDVADISRLSI